jgi:cytochrome P450
MLTELLAFDARWISRTSDAERHARLRRIVHHAFTPGQIRAAADAAERHTDSMLDAERSERLTAEGSSAVIVDLLFAGHETTTNLIAIGRLELQRPRPSGSGCAATLRWRPTPPRSCCYVSPVQFIPRPAVRELEVAGEPFPVGTTFLPILAPPTATRAPSTSRTRSTSAVPTSSNTWRWVSDRDSAPAPRSPGPRARSSSPSSPGAFRTYFSRTPCSNGAGRPFCDT